MDPVMTKLLVLAGLVVAGLAAAGCDRTTGTGPAAATTSTVQAAPPSTVAVPASWPEHTSAAGGFRLRYPPGWKVTESTGSGGATLSLLPRKGFGVSVLATTTAPTGTATRCQPVRVGGLAGNRCQDAEATLVVTTLEGPDRWYVLTGSLPTATPPAGAYDRVLASFRLS
jgi:hypothetical protein